MKKPHQTKQNDAWKCLRKGANYVPLTNCKQSTKSKNGGWGVSTLPLVRSMLPWSAPPPPPHLPLRPILQQCPWNLAVIIKTLMSLTRLTLCFWWKEWHVFLHARCRFLCWNKGLRSRFLEGAMHWPIHNRFHFYAKRHSWSVSSVHLSTWPHAHSLQLNILER